MLNKNSSHLFYFAKNVLELRNYRTRSNLSIPSPRTIIATMCKPRCLGLKTRGVANKQRNLVGRHNSMNYTAHLGRRSSKTFSPCSHGRTARHFFSSATGLVIIDIFIETVKIGALLPLCDSGLPHLSSASSLECRKNLFSEHDLYTNDRLWKNSTRWKFSIQRDLV